jgi:hypothetical protein
MKWRRPEWLKRVISVDQRVAKNISGSKPEAEEKYDAADLN